MALQHPGLAIRRTMRLLLAGSALAAAAMGSHAGPVYRCGSVYQDQPCGDGQPQAEISVPAAPSEQERTEAARRAKTEAVLAQRMVAERQAREQAEQQAAARQRPTALSQPHPSTREDDTLTRCTGTAEERLRWSKRKRDYCATHELVPPSTRKRNHWHGS